MKRSHFDSTFLCFHELLFFVLYLFMQWLFWNANRKFTDSVNWRKFVHEETGAHQTRCMQSVMQTEYLFFKISSLQRDRKLILVPRTISSDCANKKMEYCSWNLMHATQIYTFQSQLAIKFKELIRMYFQSNNLMFHFQNIKKNMMLSNDIKFWFWFEIEHNIADLDSQVRLVTFFRVFFFKMNSFTAAIILAAAFTGYTCATPAVGNCAEKCDSNTIPSTRYPFFLFC